MKINPITREEREEASGLVTTLVRLTEDEERIFLAFLEGVRMGSVAPRKQKQKERS